MDQLLLPPNPDMHIFSFGIRDKVNINWFSEWHMGDFYCVVE